MSYKQCFDYVRSDYYRITGRKDDCLFLMWKATILNIWFRYLFWWRFSKCDNLLVSTFSRIVYMHLLMKHHIDIQRDTKIGYGFKINHGGPVVINSSTIIGDNVEICQNSTIGSLFFHAANIGNEVYIGPSVCIVENVSIGDGVTIGAGSVVVHDVDKGMTVAGNPAHVISMKEPSRFINRKWNREWNRTK